MEFGILGAIVVAILGIFALIFKVGGAGVPTPVEPPVDPPVDPAPTAPTIQGWYADKRGDWWQLDESNSWHLRLDRDGIDQGALDPIDSYAPFEPINAPLWWPDYPLPPAIDPEFPPPEDPTPVDPPPVEEPPVEEPPVEPPVEEPPVVDPPSDAPDKFTEAEAQRFLARLGLPSASAPEIKESTKRFQEASAWHVFGYDAARAAGRLKVDGDFGKLTTAHARSSEANDFKISPHFRLLEWKCRCGGTNPGCLIMRVWAEMVIALEGVRADGYTTGLTITSGYRDPSANSAVGGSKTSCHLTGKAADIPRRYGPSWFKGRGFMGIEYRTAHGLVTHVDICSSRGPDFVFHE